MDDETAALLLGLGRAQVAVLAPHDYDLPVTNMYRAFEYYAESGDVSRAVAVATRQLPPSLGWAQTQLGQLIERALTLVPPDSHDAGRLLASHGWFAGLTRADHDAAGEAFDRALEIACRHGDSELERNTLADAAFVEAFHLRWVECLATGLRAIELAREARDLRTEWAARRSVVWPLVATGRREEARLQGAAALACAEALREPWPVASASWQNAVISLYEGDWDAARELGELGLAALPRDPRNLMVRALGEYQVGQYEVGAAFVARLREVVRTVPPPGPTADHVFAALVLPLAGRIEGVDEGLEDGIKAAQGLLSLPRLAPMLAAHARAGLALAATQRGDTERAEKLYQSLEQLRGTAAILLPLSFDRTLGLLATTCGRTEAAATHFEEGLAFCDHAGYRPEYA